MRIVLDTNVLISGIFFTGPQSKILAAWAAGGFDLIASVDVLAADSRIVFARAHPVETSPRAISSLHSGSVKPYGAPPSVKPTAEINSPPHSIHSSPSGVGSPEYLLLRRTIFM